MTAPVVTTFNASGTYTPTDNGLVFVQGIGAGAAGQNGGISGGDGGGAGAYSEAFFNVVKSQNYAVIAGAGVDASFIDSGTFRAAQAIGTAGGLAASCIGTLKHAGGSGSAHASTAGGQGGSPGSQTADGGMSGGTGGANGVNGGNGASPGNGGGGGGASASGGTGGAAQIVVTFLPDARHYTLQTQIQSTLQTFIGTGALPGLTPNTPVIVRMYPYGDDIGAAVGKTYGLPCILICPGVQETFTFPSNVTDDENYPVLIVILDAATTPTDPKHSLHLFWRQEIIRLFLHLKLVTTTPPFTFYDCVVEPGPIVDWGAWNMQQLVKSVIGLRFAIRTSRA